MAPPLRKRGAKYVLNMQTIRMVELYFKTHREVTKYRRTTDLSLLFATVGFLKFYVMGKVHFF